MSSVFVLPQWNSQPFQVPQLPQIPHLNAESFSMDQTTYGWDRPMLWTARAMLSSSTGTRPSGESVRLMGCWWKVDRVTDSQIARKTLPDPSLIGMGGHLRFNSATGQFEVASSTSWGSTRTRRMSTLEALSLAIEAALKEGISSSEISALVNTKIVVSVMDD